MRKWLKPPQMQQDEAAQFAANSLHYALMLFTVLAGIITILATSHHEVILTTSCMMVFIACYYLLHTGHFAAASAIFLGALWLITSFAAYTMNGVHNAGLTSYAIVIIFASILFGNKAVVLYTGLSIASILILFFGDIGGFLPLDTRPILATGRTFQEIALYASTGILLSGASRVVRTSRERAQTTELALIEQNKELQRQIRERERTEANLKTSEEKYGLLFENTPIMATIYGRDGDIQLLNKAAADAYGGQPETLQGNNIREFIAAEDAEYAIQDHLFVMETGKPVLNEENVTMPDGEEKILLRHIIPLPQNDGGQVTQVLVLTTDQTEKHYAEQRKRELEITKQKNTFLTEFFGTVSHDLKTPLATMNTSLYLLERAKTTEQVAERAARITEQVGLMDQYIQDMLTIARLEHLPATHFEPLELFSLLDEVVALLKPRIESKKITFEVINGLEQPQINGDEEQIRRLFMNLIENAINYTPESGTITLKTYNQDGQTFVEVADSGIGIEEEAIPYIFERFFRTATAKITDRKGTGLGLSIVKKVAEVHNAGVAVKSNIGEGTTFTVNFPPQPPYTHP